MSNKNIVKGLLRGRRKNLQGRKNFPFETTIFENGI